MRADPKSTKNIVKPSVFVGFRNLHAQKLLVNVNEIDHRSTCRRCHGKGTWNKSPCKDCRGAGQTKQRRKITVPVPAGIEDGQTVRMAVGSKEVFITFRVESSDYFKRQGADIHTDAKISLAQVFLLLSDLLVNRSKW